MMIKKLTYHLPLIALLLFIGIIPTHALADTHCFSLNNGGPTTKQFCLQPAPEQIVALFPTPAPFKETNGTQPIFPSPKTKSTPNTGPENWSFVGLLFLGGMGIVLRNKAKT